MIQLVNLCNDITNFKVSSRLMAQIAMNCIESKNPNFIHSVIVFRGYLLHFSLTEYIYRIAIADSYKIFTVYEKKINVSNFVTFVHETIKWLRIILTEDDSTVEVNDFRRVIKQFQLYPFQNISIRTLNIMEIKALENYKAKLLHGNIGYY